VNKSDLVSRMTERLGGDRAIAAAAVNGVLEEIENSVARGERVSLHGFGTFDRRERAPRTGRNPRTGAAIQLAASVAPVFRPGTAFRTLLAQNGGSASTATAAVIPPEDSAPTKKKAKKSAMSAPTKTAAAGDAGKSGKKAARKAAKKAAKKGR
jgi:DNA-binding protein HU-beta